ncbi:MAG TPA: hypothetical protein VI756_23760 [Blastocatellia bacterium]
MGLTMREKKALVKAMASRYRRSTKKQKKKILDEFVESTEYNRSYASLVLSKLRQGSLDRRTTDRGRSGQGAP